MAALLGSAPDRKAAVDQFEMPDLPSLSDGELKQLIDDLMKEEAEVSYRRRILHGKIDILRAERNARLRKTEGKSILDEVDVDRLTEILAAKAPPPNPE
jgi:anti-sigma-K factor RsiG